MIQKNEESGKEEGKKISSFKKFSELGKKKSNKNTKISDPKIDILPETDSDLPANPNLPNNKSKVQKPQSTRHLRPIPNKGINFKKQEDNFGQEEISEKNIEFFGKVAKLPKGTKASKGFNFLENVKISKGSIWYILVEKQSDELQMVKYNYKKGVDLNRFVNDLKVYYKSKYSKNSEISKVIENIHVDGNDKYSMIRNIPLIEVDGKKMISKITEDLIKLLSK